MCLVTWPVNESEAGVDLVLIETSLPFLCKFLLISVTTKKKKKSKVVHLYSALITTSQRRFTMINLPPADWKHIQAQIAAASKQSMHAGTHNIINITK